MEVVLKLDHKHPVGALLQLVTAVSGISEVEVIADDTTISNISLSSYLHRMNQEGFISLTGLNASKLRILAAAKAGCVVFLPHPSTLDADDRLFVNFGLEPVRAVLLISGVHKQADNFMEQIFAEEYLNIWSKCRRLHRKLERSVPDPAALGEWLRWPGPLPDPVLKQERLF